MAVSRKLKNVKPVIKQKEESNVEEMKSSIVIQAEKSTAELKAEREKQKKISERSDELIENLRSKMKSKKSLKQSRREKENAVPKKTGLLKGGLALAIFFAAFALVFVAITSFMPLNINNYVDANVNVQYFVDDGNGNTGYNSYTQSLSLYTDDTPTTSYIQDYSSIKLNFAQVSQTKKISSITFKIKVGTTGALKLKCQLFDINKSNSLVSTLPINENVTEGEVLTVEWKIREKIDFTKVKEGDSSSGILITAEDASTSTFAIFNLKMHK